MVQVCTTLNTPFVSLLFLFADEKGPFVMDWLIKPLLLKKVLRNMGAMESYLVENCPDINYTVVKPPGLSNAAKTGKIFAVVYQVWSV